MNLQDEIDIKSKEVNSENFKISIGEMVSMYKDKELDIHPDFQRVFRWSVEQKSRLIESIILGIPIPSIFVAQRNDGVWDVIDGVQRLSTIFQLMGVLRNSDGSLLPQLELTETKYLKNLKNKIWEIKAEDNDDELEESLRKSLTPSQRLFIKRYAINIQVIKKESDVDAKYELFQRLNTGGSNLSPQEIRNCLILMINKEKFEWFSELSHNKDFQECLPLTERMLLEKYDIELITRFIIYRHCEAVEISRSSELNEFINDKISEIISNNSINFEHEKIVFEKTFKVLNEVLQEDAFRKWSSSKDKFIGPFSISAYEAIIPGLSENIDTISHSSLKNKIIKMWSVPQFHHNSGAGLRAADRAKHLFPFSRSYFK